MKKSLKVQINQPCHENWENMNPSEQGRFCGSCQKTVIDFTQMTDQEILVWVTRPGKDTCGRFSNDQLQRDLVIHREKKFSFRYAWQLMIASFLIAGKGEAQTGKPIFIKTEMKNLPAKNDFITLGYTTATIINEITISGMVTDSSNSNPLSYASIVIKGTSTGYVTDSTGKFTFQYDGDQKNVELEFSYLGYKSKSILVSRETNHEAVNISLSPSQDFLMGDVVTVGLVSTVCVRKATVIQKLRNYADDLLPSKKEIVVYPNPISPGSSINLSLDLKQAGQYKLELTDASGRLVLSKSITIGSVKQQESLTTSAGWSKGVYYLRISQAGKKFNKTTKVLLQ